jgi:hypothetical protein
MNELVGLNAGALAQVTGDPGEYVVLACERAKAWLADALEHGDIDHIVELKSQAEAIRVYTSQKNLGKDAELSAAEIVRRAERGIGVAIRRGQEAGEIRRTGQHAGNQYSTGSGDNPPSSDLPPAPTAFAKAHELSGGGGGVGIYDLTDDVTDDDFEAALLEAKADGNLSRRNVVRKAKGEPGLHAKKRRQLDRQAEVRRLYQEGRTVDEIARILNAKASTIRGDVSDLGIARGQANRGIDSNRVVTETVDMLAGFGTGIDLVNYEALERDRLDSWVASLTNSISVISKFRNRLRKEATRDEA